MIGSGRASTRRPERGWRDVTQTVQDEIVVGRRHIVRRRTRYWDHTRTLADASAFIDT